MRSRYGATIIPAATGDLATRAVVHADRQRLESLVLFPAPGQQESIRLHGPALHHFGDHIRATDPMRLGKIGS